MMRFRSAASILLLMVLLYAASAAAADVLVIDTQPWTGAQPQSPAFAAGQSGLDFALVPATGSLGPTLALLGLARVPGRYAEIYHGRIAGALRIIVVDLHTAAMYQGHAEPRNTVPLSTVLNSEPPPGAAETGLVDTYFNVDLRVQLALPDSSAKYAVFVWLEDLVSPIRIAQMPGDIPKQRPPKPVDASALGIHFGATPKTPSGEEGIVLRGDGSRVYGLAAPGAPHGMLRVLVLDFRTRALGSITFALPKHEDAFDFDLSILGGYDSNARGMQKTFVLVGWGTIWSQPLVVDRTPHS